ncbi:MAG: BrnT family toxin [Tissierellales bacterium]|nr:BrnT family toxin [Tissierellales bacterium]
MNDIQFKWDEKKNRENQRKHKVTFEEAQTVFYDENALRYFDPDHSDDEDRFLMLGMSFTLHVLVVCHCCRENESVIRIISARKANKQEQSIYWR